MLGIEGVWVNSVKIGGISRKNCVKYTFQHYPGNTHLNVALGC